MNGITKGTLAPQQLFVPIIVISLLDMLVKVICLALFSPGSMFKNSTCFSNDNSLLSKKLLIDDSKFNLKNVTVKKSKQNTKR